MAEESRDKAPGSILTKCFLLGDRIGGTVQRAGKNEWIGNIYRVARLKPRHCQKQIDGIVFKCRTLRIVLRRLRPGITFCGV